MSWEQFGYNYNPDNYGLYNVLYPLVAGNALSGTKSKPAFGEFPKTVSVCPFSRPAFGDKPEGCALFEARVELENHLVQLESYIPVEGD